MKTKNFSIGHLVCFSILLLAGCVSVKLPSLDRLTKLFTQRAETYATTVQVRAANKGGEIASFGTTSMDQIRSNYTAIQVQYEGIIGALKTSIRANSNPKDYQSELDNQLDKMEKLVQALRSNVNQIKYRETRGPLVQISDPWSGVPVGVAKAIVEIWRYNDERVNQLRTDVISELQNSVLPNYSSLLPDK